jgi:hypothetical protein
LGHRLALERRDPHRDDRNRATECDLLLREHRLEPGQLVGLDVEQHQVGPVRCPVDLEGAEQILLHQGDGGQQEAAETE